MSSNQNTRTWTPGRYCKHSESQARTTSPAPPPEEGGLRSNPPEHPGDQFAQLRGHQHEGGQGDALDPGLGLEGNGAEGLA